MSENKRFNPWIVVLFAAGLGLVVVVCTCVGVVVGVRVASQNAVQQPLPLQAGTAAKGKSLSMATGLIDGEVEGLYVLDHVSGNLQCWILNSRTGAVGGIYRANVANDLMTDKAGETDYVMTTGNFFFSGGSAGNAAPAQSIVYVADEATGNVVGYSLVYDKQGIRRGVVQAGILNLVCKGPTRGEQTTRDQ